MRARDFRVSLGVFVFFSLPLLASSEPPDPNPGVDPKLFATTTPKEFFQAREQDPELADCRDNLNRLRSQYRLKKEELGRLQQASQPFSEEQKNRLDEVEDEAVRIRRRMLPLIQSCGNCVTAPMAAPQVFSKPGHAKKIWYAADGSCQIDPKNQKAFETISASLLHLHRYPKQNGGFYNILAMTGLQNEKGPLTPALNAVSASPFYAFIAVRGPKLPELLGGPLYMAYYFRNEYKKNNQELILTYHSYPGLGQQPKVEDIRASGRARTLNKFPIQDVKGMWYVNLDGYVRYQTSGNFGKMVPFANEMAESTLLETLVETAERGM